MQHLVDLELPSHQGVIGADDVSRSFRSRDGNVREVMFDLYDLFEQRRNMKRDLSAQSHAERECNGCNNYNGRVAGISIGFLFLEPSTLRGS